MLQAKGGNMKIRIGHPLIQWGKSDVAFDFSAGLTCCDMGIGSWSLGAMFGSYWISLDFQFRITKGA